MIVCIMIQTYSVSFPRRTKRSKISLAMWLFAFATFFSALYLNNSSYWVVACVAIVPIFFVLDRLAYSRENPEKYFNKPLVITENEIALGEMTFLVKELTNIKVMINEYDGEILGGRGKKILNGTKNFVYFSHPSGRIAIRFYICSEEQKNTFKLLFDGWYKSKVNFYEGNVSGRTYLLESLNYKQIQEFKKRYELVSCSGVMDT